MAAAGFTPISLYYSATASAQPTAPNLVLGELALNITDGKLYYKDSVGGIILLADKTTASGIANDLAGGTVGALPYQSATNVTSFLPLGTSGYILTSDSISPVYTDPADITVGGASLATRADNISGGTNGQLLYQSAPNTTSFTAIPTSAGTVLSWNGSGYSWIFGVPSSTAGNILGGTAGTVVYQSATDTTAFAAVGTTGQVFLSNGTAAPSWADQSSLVVGFATTATTATNIAGGDAGVVPFKSAAGATGFTAVGTTGQVLLSGGTGSPTWIDQSAIAAGSTALATNIAGGDAGRIVYQSAPDTTAFTDAGLVGQVLVSNGLAAPTWGTGSPPALLVTLTQNFGGF